MKTANNWPKNNKKDIIGFYGEMGKNQTRVNVPYPLKFSWDNKLSVSKISAHEKVADSLQRVLESILDTYGLDEIERLSLNQWGGGFNVRRIRGSSNSWSTHSWGIANDWFPQENGLHVKWEDSTFSKPEYVPFINAWIIEGWNPIGLSSFNRDSMHIQATENDLELLTVFA